MAVTCAALVHLNNEGVRFIQSRQYLSAIETISNALNFLFQHGILQPPGRNSSLQEVFLCQLPNGARTASMAGRDRQYPDYFFVCHQLDAKKAEPNDSDYHSTPDNWRHLVFDCPILVLSGDGDGYASELSFVFLWNLALAHHLGTLEGLNDWCHLQTALKLYGLASSAHCESRYHLAMANQAAVLNNTGQIQMLLGDEEEAQCSFEDLLGILLLLCHGGTDERLDSLPSDVFLESAIQAIFVGPPPAPAA
jgi:hypothetical protein